MRKSLRPVREPQAFCAACQVFLPVSRVEAHGQTPEHIAAESAWRSDLRIRQAIAVVEARDHAADIAYI